MFKIHYYKTARGEKVVEEFILSLDPKTQAKISQMIDLLEKIGPELRRPYADIVKGKIRELRVRFAYNQIRLLYSFFFRDNIVFLHGFRKKTDVIPVSEIEQAERNMNDFISRHKRGEIQI